MAIDLKGTKWRALRRDENGAQRIASFGTKKAVTENQITASIDHGVGGHSMRARVSAILSVGMVLVLAVGCVSDHGGTGGITSTTATTTPAGVVGSITEWGFFGRNFQPKSLVSSGAAGKLSDPGGTGGTTTTTTPAGAPSRVVGYFTEWGIYGRNFQPKSLVSSGAAGKLTHLNLAFGNVTGGRCSAGDTYAENGKVYNAASSVDGVADSTAAGTLHGIFGQFRKLKVLYPGLKILWSFGGGTGSGGFPLAALNPTAFAESCYALVHDPEWSGVFDGIDIDWEFPNACGVTCDASGPTAYPVVMSAMRSRFGSELVTSAVTASPSKIAAGGYGTSALSVDWFNVMTYDFFGAWAATGPTAPQSALSDYAGIPIAGFSTQGAVAAYRNLGVPASKLLIGVGFYGRGWAGVTQVAPGGSASGPAAGTYEAGVEDYKALAVSCPPTGVVGGTAYGSCGSNWWSYDTPATLASKMAWAKSQGLGGVFAWELSGDTPAGVLVGSLYDNR